MKNVYLKIILLLGLSLALYVAAPTNTVLSADKKVLECQPTPSPGIDGFIGDPLLTEDPDCHGVQRDVAFYPDDVAGNFPFPFNPPDPPDYPPIPAWCLQMTKTPSKICATPSDNSVTYTISIQNNCQFPVVIDHIADTQAGNITGVTIPAGSFHDFTYTTTVSATTTNVAEIVGTLQSSPTEPLDVSVTATVVYDPVNNCTNPPKPPDDDDDPGNCFSLSKSVNQTCIEGNSGQVTYTYTVSNACNFQITNITINDNRIGQISFPGSMNAHETQTRTVTTNVSAPGPLPSILANTATMTAAIQTTPVYTKTTTANASVRFRNNCTGTCDYPVPQYCQCNPNYGCGGGHAPGTEWGDAGECNFPTGNGMPTCTSTQEIWCGVTSASMITQFVSPYTVACTTGMAETDPNFYYCDGGHFNEPVNNYDTSYPPRGPNLPACTPYIASGPSNTRHFVNYLWQAHGAEYTGWPTLGPQGVTYQARTLRGGNDYLTDLRAILCENDRVPIIVKIKWEVNSPNHFTVLRGMTDTAVILNDPWWGYREMPVANFLQRSGWINDGEGRWVVRVPRQ